MRMPAQRNIETCASCHSGGYVLGLPRTTDAALPGLNVSPHGGGFGGSARCDALERSNRRVCLKCHAPGDPGLDCR
ncbi:MAG: hypothetical protein HC927_07480 [Deltaproteobacteria bacterium]|nr:hypothetical protein [Deltaproteobacteria bacterium]